MQYGGGPHHRRCRLRSGLLDEMLLRDDCPDGHLAVFHGPRRLADYEPDCSVVADVPAGHPVRFGRDIAARDDRCRQLQRTCTTATEVSSNDRRQK